MIRRRRIMIQRIYKKLFNKETISYLFFGVLTTLVNLAVYSLGDFSGLDYRVSNVAAWIISVIFAYVTNKLFVFESTSWRLPVLTREFISFVSCRLLSGIFEMAALIALVELLMINKFIAKVIISIIVVLMNYVFSKLFIFKNNPIKN